MSNDRNRRRTPPERPGGGTEEQAKEACLDLLTDRARSRHELEEKLAARGFSDAVAAAALDRLAAVGLVDDADFARQWVRSRHTYSGKGKRALARELRRKGIAEEQAAEALDLIDADSERERAEQLVARKLGTAAYRAIESPEDRERALRRLVSMLARKGYAPGMAYSVARDALNSQFG
jgi:regulatory protein